MFSVLIVGRLTRSKNVAAGIKAVQKLRSVKLVIVGDGPDRRRLETLANEQVEFKGRVSDAELSKLYSMCDLLLFPALREPFGLVPIEAMHHGKPVICSMDAGVAEVVNAAQCGFLANPRDAGDIAEKMRVLLDDRDLRKKMGENGRRYIQQLTKDRFISEFERILATTIT